MMALIAVIMTGLGLLVLAVTFLLVRTLTRRQESSPVTDEARMVQDMYRTLGRLENRVEVLETLLADHSAEAHDARQARDDEPGRTL